MKPISIFLISERIKDCFSPGIVKIFFGNYSTLYSRQKFIAALCKITAVYLLLAAPAANFSNTPCSYPSQKLSLLFGKIVAVYLLLVPLIVVYLNKPRSSMILFKVI